MFVATLIILLVLDAALIAHAMYHAPVIDDEEFQGLSSEED